MYVCTKQIWRLIANYVVNNDTKDGVWVPGTAIPCGHHSKCALRHEGYASHHQGASICAGRREVRVRHSSRHSLSTRSAIAAANHVVAVETDAELGFGAGERRRSRRVRLAQPLFSVLRDGRGAIRANTQIRPLTMGPSGSKRRWGHGWEVCRIVMAIFQ